MFSGGLGACSAKKILKILFKKLLTWVILKYFFPLITHWQFMKYSVEISSEFFCTFTIFWLRGHQLDIGGGATTPPAPPPLRSPLFEELWSDILPSVKNIGWCITHCPPELMPLFQRLGPQKKTHGTGADLGGRGKSPFALKIMYICI